MLATSGKIEDDAMGGEDMKKRVRNAWQGRSGAIAVEQACNRLDLIWRNLLEEDVGVDGTIEIALGEFPTLPLSLR